MSHEKIREDGLCLLNTTLCVSYQTTNWYTRDRRLPDSSNWVEVVGGEHTEPVHCIQESNTQTFYPHHYRW